MKNRRIPRSFEQLVQTYYGNAGGHGQVRPLTVDRLYANYYGRPLHHSHHPKRRRVESKVVTAQSVDDGETLRQKTNEGFEEYVVGGAVAAAVSEEYVIDSPADPKATPSLAPSAKATPAAPAGTDVSPQEERQVDVMAPLPSAPAGKPGTEDGTPTKTALEDWPLPDHWGDESAADPAGPAAPPAAPTNATASPSPASAEPPKTEKQKAEDDFIADMQSIISGEKVYDPRVKKMVHRDELSSPQSQQPPAPPPPPAGDAGNAHAIFEKIAQSMQYANAYDLGTVDLDNRFAEFDRMDDAPKRPAARPVASRVAPPPAEPLADATPDTDEFIEDLDTIRHPPPAPTPPASAPVQGVGLPIIPVVPDVPGMPRIPIVAPQGPYTPMPMGPSTAPPDPLALAASLEYSRPFYDTGEHAQAAGDLYKDELPVGNPPVFFSYGQIIAMGDLFETVDDMQRASSAELQALKDKIDQSTRYYAGGKKDPALDVGDVDWERITNRRYLKLAEDNYSHFSPEMLFGIPVDTHEDHKSMWETYHRRAIKEMQANSLVKGKDVADWGPLITNAFGDHFLTDAFAAGHTISKAEIIAYFKSIFFDKNGELTPAASAFFGKLADATWNGDVKAKFSQLETVKSYGVWILSGHPNIDSAGRFADVLRGIATEKAEAVGNLFVKVIHDKLNAGGIEVVNAAGDGPWKLTGDTTLDATNLRIIKKAVQQSINNILDPSILQNNLDFPTYFAKVWQYVPILTSASTTKVKRMAVDLVRPDSSELLTAAASLVKRKVDFLIAALKEAKVLRDR